ncbi:hypothetical protein ABZV60_30420 [Streptomyces sp. NPDC004787]|uniref:terpene synthase family protein n=1 Tax=Streptomyces sp. NPDC004787 TaxID=3154291 RepID=UPI0033AB73C9
MNEARGDDLALITDITMWLLFYDDLFQHIVDKPQQIAPIIQDTLTALHASPGSVVASGSRADHALQDLIQRTNALMSDEWMRRFRCSVSAFFASILNKSLILQDGTPPDVDDALRLRAEDVGVRWILDVIELYRHFELPPVVILTQSFQRMQTLIVELAALQNDVSSLQRDLKDPENDGFFNVVLALERQHRQGISQALRLAHAMYHHRLAELRTVRYSLTRQLACLELDEDTLIGTRQYIADACNLVPALIHAHLDLAAARGYFREAQEVEVGPDLLTDNRLNVN